MRLLLLLIPILLQTGCTHPATRERQAPVDRNRIHDPAPAQQPADVPPPAGTDPQPQTSRHAQTPALAPLSVEFASPLRAGKGQATVKAGDEVPLTVTLCNGSISPMEGVEVALKCGSFASLAEQQYNDLTFLAAPLAAAGPGCGDPTQATELRFTLQTRDDIKPGTAVSISPVLVVRWRDQVETFESPFKILVMGLGRETEG